jgi:sarcosine oxidase, subunit delta
MKILICPLNGPRNIAEFTYGGQVKTMPDPREATDREWAQYVFYEDSHIGVVREWWMHTASSFWFIAERHNQTDEVLRTYDPAELFDPVVDRSVMQASEETAFRPHKDGQPPDGKP